MNRRKAMAQRRQRRHVQRRQRAQKKERAISQSLAGETGGRSYMQGVGDRAGRRASRQSGGLVAGYLVSLAHGPELKTRYRGDK